MVIPQEKEKKESLFKTNFHLEFYILRKNPLINGIYKT